MTFIFVTYRFRTEGGKLILCPFFCWRGDDDPRDSFFTRPPLLFGLLLLSPFYLLQASKREKIIFPEPVVRSRALSADALLLPGLGAIGVLLAPDAVALHAPRAAQPVTSSRFHKGIVILAFRKRGRGDLCWGKHQDGYKLKFLK